jgi:N-acetylmuramoyl-L-alanine amidase
MARVLISAGHTQNEPGAVKGDLREVDLTRKIASKVITRLRQEGIVTLSVPRELDLLSRIDWINKTGYQEATEDICIEFHVNDGGKSGLEGWFKTEGQNKSQELVDSILSSACEETKLTNQGAKSEFDHPLKTLAFLHNTNPTSALIECLYIDNPDDVKFLKDEAKLDQLANGIVKGILKFFKIEEKDKASLPTAQTPMPQTYRPPSFTAPYQTGYTPTFPTQPYSPYSASSAFGTTKVPIQTREEQKKMIKDKYQQILGRKVSNQDLNYFANLNLSEDQMTSRLVQSQEHADLVKDAQEFKDIEPKYKKLENESKELKAQVSDKEKIIQQLNELIAQKNNSIQLLQQGKQPQISQVAPAQPRSETPPQSMTTGYQEIPQYKESFLDKVLKKLNDIFD